MKIIFICGSLEHGKDGVGDYTRRLAGELIRRGHKAIIISLNDHYVSTGRDKLKNRACLVGTNKVGHSLHNTSKAQSDGKTPVPTIRLSAQSRWKLRKKHLEAALNMHKPDVLSIQFVPFSYSNKGLPTALIRCLDGISFPRCTHVMFHELWLRPVPGSRIAVKIISIFQKALIWLFLHRIKPTLIHSNLPESLQRIQEIGFSGRGLPIFSNLKSSAAEEPEIDENCKTKVNFRVGLFSRFDLEISTLDFLQKLSDDVKKRGYRFNIILIGGRSESSEKAVNQLRKSLAVTPEIFQTGFVSETEAIEAIRTCSMGLSPVPKDAAGKSGSIAAFISEGVPVAVPRLSGKVGPESIGLFPKELHQAFVSEASVEAIELAQMAVRKYKNLISLSKVADNFLDDLSMV